MSGAYLQQKFFNLVLKALFNNFGASRPIPSPGKRMIPSEDELIVKQSILPKILCGKNKIWLKHEKARNTTKYA